MQHETYGVILKTETLFTSFTIITDSYIPETQSVYL